MFIYVIQNNLEAFLTSHHVLIICTEEKEVAKFALFTPQSILRELQDE